MFLRRLDLVGFKSFAPRTSTELLPGIVVVVGPNGSGKSNIADAVLWVLGEQSAKAVRARKPEEVIFAGSASRQPLGMAEVSLVLDNADASLPIEYAEVRVTRRLYRSGDSEYLLNGARVRLKDITQLLLHAGLSPDSYSVIGQGSIDELILQRPDERRVVFENAADIRRHQLRLQDTRSKLSHTEANLVRVQDVLAELTPHVRRLKTQAERAQRADTFRGELHDLLLRFFRARLARAHQAQRDTQAQLVDATTEARQAELDSLAGEQALKELDQRLAALEAHFSEARPRAESLLEQARSAERSLAVTRERLAGLGLQRSGLDAELARLTQALERLTLEEAQARRVSGLNDAESDAAPDAAQRLEAARGRLAEVMRALAGVQSERSVAQQTYEAAERRMRDAEARLARIEHQLQSLQAALAVDQARQTDRQARIAGLEQLGGQRQQESSVLEAGLEQARARMTAASAARRDAALRLEHSGEALRAASQLADRLQGSLAALGAEDLNAPYTGDLPPDWQAALRDLPVVGLAGELATRIRPIDLQLAGYLRRIVVLSSDASAREAYARLSTHLASDAPAWGVLSVDGLLLAAAGERPLDIVGDDGQAGLADWARQVRQLEDELAAAESRRRVALGQVQSARDAVDDAEADQQAARAKLGEVEARLAEARRAETGARNELHQLRADDDRAARAAAQREEERARANSRAQATRDELGLVRAQRDTAAEALRLLDERLPTLNEQVGQLRAEVAALEAAEGRRESERAAREALQARIRAEIAATLTARETAGTRMAQLGAHQAELEEQVGSLSSQMLALERQLAPLDAELRSAEQRRSGLLAERQQIEQQLVGLRAVERSAHESREARHVAAQRAADEVERLNTEIDETAELESEMAGGAAWAEQLRLQFGELAQPAAPFETFDLEAARRRIATLQRELRAVGGVADSVVVEYRELSDRHAFLDHQSGDLRTAMAELHSAASELEGHMRERFAEVFTAIQAAFQECFSKLFGGGEARLVLTEPDDVLRTGIDIVARPPGKKLQGLLSLSGGERALTIVSLLLGLLKINPTPFCVLDEVDAALDEANVQRFANLLAEFARQIQFIVVTHNRATMDKADAMYGVSMDAQGISHIFSVQPRVLVGAAHA